MLASSPMPQEDDDDGTDLQLHLDDSLEVGPADADCDANDGNTIHLLEKILGFLEEEDLVMGWWYHLNVPF